MQKGISCFPPDFIARLAALVPRPRVHLVRYHRLFAPNAKHRHHIVTAATSALPPDNAQGSTDETGEPKSTAPSSWMQRLRRVFKIDLSHCPHCGGTVRVIAAITDPALIARILAHRDRQAMVLPLRRLLAPLVHHPRLRRIRSHLTSDCGVCQLSRITHRVR